ncbi:MAG: ATPase [Acidobacteriota bacterium]|nr:ATPase [Acidobacteriota bacterium]
MIDRMLWSRLAVAAGDADAGDLTRLVDSDLYILVGVTGVGKTTALQAVGDRLELCVLPDRRSVADEVILPAAQALEGESPSPVADRVERFRLTARYRDRHHGGIAEALASLAFTGSERRVLFFDGLRGAAECGWAATHLPRASFVVLEAPTAIRLQRLLGRRSDFDRAPVALDVTVAGSLLERVPGLADLLSETELGRVLAVAQAAGTSSVDVAEKAAIIVAEARNYDTGEAISILRSELAEKRLLVVDTSDTAPDAVGHCIAKWIRRSRLGAELL